MKRVIQHPDRPERPTMWRSLAELENSPEFEETLQREFPAGAGVYEDSGMSKRDFMKLMGASVALAGVGLTGCRRPASFLVPLNEGVEWTIPGKFLYYSTSMPTRHGAMPLVATTVDGRPTKMEGNPMHPASNGGTDGFAQASILDLYDPHRSKKIRKGDAEVTREEFDAFLAEVRKAGLAGEGIAVLAGQTNSPTRERLRAALKAEFPKLIWAEYEPLGTPQRDKANAVAYGGGSVIRPNLEAADVVLALDSDFLNCGETGIGYAKGFSARRKPDADRPMNRLYVVENHYSITGGLADHRLRLKASEIGAFAAAVGAKVAEATGNSSLAALVSRLNPAGIAEQWLNPCVEDLVKNREKSLVLVGPEQPWQVQVLVAAINEALGNRDKTFSVLQGVPNEAASISELAEALSNDQIQTLFVFGGNPAYDAPADLDFAKMIEKAGTVVRVSLFEDETSALADWQVPATHYLEEWSDCRGPEGTLTSVQPMILPLYDSVSDLEIMAALLGRETPVGPELVKETLKETVNTDGQALDLEWNEFLRKGNLANSAFPVSQVAFDGAKTASALAAEPMSTPQGEVELVFLQSSSVDDGRYANNSWLLETPDFETKLTWDNAALLSPHDAKELGVKDGDWVEISAGETKLEIPVVIAPGHADNSVSVALGFGRKDVSALMQGVGFDIYPFRTTATPRYRTGVKISDVSGKKKYPLARPQEHQSMEGRDLFREGTLETYEHDPKFAQTMGMDGHLPPERSIYDNPYFQPEQLSKEQWAMTVDLATCTGCNACVVACQAENNVPVVGKDQVIRGRDMAWIRIDRYFASPESSPDEPEMVAQMITCQHCENAPCETVCPVNATVHSEDGLNLMAYNRCIGTRYCANNCPWKVRRFNYFDYNQRPIDELYFGPLAKKGMADSLKMAKNPNVTVRMRGVMEKCTFCIQRIEEAKIARLVKAGASDKNKTPVGIFKVACQQACPSESIVFGNENDPNQPVHHLRTADRGFTMLKYVNARPRITYLARIKNPNMAMPGAAGVGNINTPAHHGHDEAHGSKAHTNAAGSPVAPAAAHH